VPDTPDLSQVVEGCSICGSPCGDQANLCRTHTDQLAADLATVPELVAELQITLTRQDRVTAEKHGGRSATKPLPWNEHASQRAFELNTTLNAWALDTSKLAEDERDPLIEQHHSDTAGVARWLGRNLRTLRQHQDAGQAHDEITDAIKEARRAIDRPGLSSRFYVGPCPEELDSVPCGGDVWAFIPSERDKLATIRCTNCGAFWDTTQWLRVGRRILQMQGRLKAA
jgi:hypothetical protein